MTEIEFLLDFDNQVNNINNNDSNSLSTVTPFDHSLNLDLSLGLNFCNQNNNNNGFDGNSSGFDGNSNDSRYGLLLNDTKERDLGLGFCNENRNIGVSNGLGFCNENRKNNGFGDDSNDSRYGIMLDGTSERNLGFGFCNENRNIDGTRERVSDLGFRNENREKNGFGDDLDDFRCGIASNDSIERNLGLGFCNGNRNFDDMRERNLGLGFCTENENIGGSGGSSGLGIFDENRNFTDFEDKMDMDVCEYGESSVPADGRKETALSGRVGNGSDEEIQGHNEDENGRRNVQIGSQNGNLDDHMDDSCCAFMSGDPWESSDGRGDRALAFGVPNENRSLGDFDDIIDGFGSIMSPNGRELSDEGRNLEDFDDDMADSVYGIMMTDSWDFSISPDEEIQAEFGDSIVNQDQNLYSNNVQARLGWFSYELEDRRDTFEMANERGVPGMLLGNMDNIPLEGDHVMPSIAALEQEFPNTIFWTSEDEYEMLVGQLENEVPNKPTSKTVVENLQMVTMTKCDVDNDKATCAICRDDMGIGEKAKLLPCSHRYHGCCIDEWLGIRNTCPVCRYELPTE